MTGFFLVLRSTRVSLQEAPGDTLVVPYLVMMSASLSTELPFSQCATEGLTHRQLNRPPVSEFYLLRYDKKLTASTILTCLNILSGKRCSLSPVTKNFARPKTAVSKIRLSG